MKEDGPTTLNVAMGFSGNQMGLSIEVAGGTASSKAKDMRSGPMEPNILANMFKARKKVVESICGMIRQSTSVSGPMTSFTVLVYIFGEMEGPTADSGATGTCMASAGTPLATVDDMRASTLTIGNMDTEFTPGPMVEFTKVTGRMESSMDLVSTLYLRRTVFRRKGTGGGKRVHASNGLS